MTSVQPPANHHLQQLKSASQRPPYNLAPIIPFIILFLLLFLTNTQGVPAAAASAGLKPGVTSDHMPDCEDDSPGSILSGQPPLHVWTNTDSAHKRRGFMEQQLQQVQRQRHQHSGVLMQSDAIRVTAVDAGQLWRRHPEIWGEDGQAQGEPDKSPGVAACSISHLQAVLTAYLQGACWALVTEDDILLPWELHWGSLASSLPPGWGSAQLFWIQGPQGQTGDQEFREWTASGRLWRPHMWQHTFGTHAYLISRHGMRSILSNVTSAASSGGLQVPRQPQVTLQDATVQPQDALLPTQRVPTTKVLLASSTNPTRHLSAHNAASDDDDDDDAELTSWVEAVYLSAFFGQPADQLVFSLAAPAYATRFPFVVPVPASVLPSQLHAEHEERFLAPAMTQWAKVLAAPRAFWPRAVRGLMPHACSHMDCSSLPRSLVEAGQGRQKRRWRAQELHVREVWEEEGGDGVQQQQQGRQEVVEGDGQGQGVEGRNQVQRKRSESWAAAEAAEVRPGGGQRGGLPDQQQQQQQGLRVTQAGLVRRSDREAIHETGGVHTMQEQQGQQDQGGRAAERDGKVQEQVNSQQKQQQTGVSQHVTQLQQTVQTGQAPLVTGKEGEDGRPGAAAAALDIWGAEGHLRQHQEVLPGHRSQGGTDVQQLSQGQDGQQQQGAGHNAAGKQQQQGDQHMLQGGTHHRQNQPGGDLDVRHKQVSQHHQASGMDQLNTVHMVQQAQAAAGGADAGDLNIWGREDDHDAVLKEQPVVEPAARGVADGSAHQSLQAGSKQKRGQGGSRQQGVLKAGAWVAEGELNIGSREGTQIPGEQLTTQANPHRHHNYQQHQQHQQQQGTQQGQAWEQQPGAEHLNEPLNIWGKEPDNAAQDPFTAAGTGGSAAKPHQNRDKQKDSSTSTTSLPVYRPGGPVPLNVFPCRREYLDPPAGRLTPQHARIYLLTLPPSMAKQLQPRPCGKLHGLRDGFVVDSEPLGQVLDDELITSPSIWGRAGPGGLAARQCATDLGRLYTTNQYSGRALWVTQIAASPLRTLHLEDADMVVVDLIDDACMTMNSWHWLELKALMRAALQWVADHQARHPAKPHVVPLSRNEASYWEDGGLLSLPEATSLTWVSQELTDLPEWGMQAPPASATWLSPPPPWAWPATSHPPGDAAQAGSKGAAGSGAAAKEGAVDLQALPTPARLSAHHWHNVVARPFPSTLHATVGTRGSGSPYFTALASGNATCLQAALSAKRRLASAAFVVRSGVRAELKEQCSSDPQGRCQFMQADFQTTMKAGEGLVSLHALMATSWFCLMPPGDFHSRRAIFDCLLQGSIPVLFRTATRDLFPYSDLIDPDSLMVTLPPGLHDQLEAAGVKLGFGATPPNNKGPPRSEMKIPQVLDILEREYPLNVRMRMVARIHALKHIFQDSVDPVTELVRFDQLHIVHCLDDALTATLKAVLRNLCRRGLLPQRRCSGYVVGGHP